MRQSRLSLGDHKTEEDAALAISKFIEEERKNG